MSKQPKVVNDSHNYQLIGALGELLYIYRNIQSAEDTCDEIFAKIKLLQNNEANGIVLVYLLLSLGRLSQTKRPLKRRLASNDYMLSAKAANLIMDMLATKMDLETEIRTI